MIGNQPTKSGDEGSYSENIWKDLRATILLKISMIFLSPIN